MLLLGLALLMLILFILLCVFFSDWVAINIFDKPDVKLEFDPGLWWWFKRWLTMKIVINGFKDKLLSNQFIVSQEIINEKSSIEGVAPWILKYMYPDGDLYTTKTPYFEQSWKRVFGIVIMHIVFKFFPLAEPNLPQIPDNYDDLLILCYPQAYRDLLPAPQLPKVVSDNLNDLVGALSLAGPFAEYIAYNSNTGYYEIDLSSYWKYEVKEDLEYIGAKAILEYDTYHKKMKTKSIEYYSKRDKKNIIAYLGDHNWKKAQDIMMASIRIDADIGHMLTCHMLIVGTFCAVNNNYLDKDHPLRRLMHAHQLGVLSVNNLESPIYGFYFFPLVHSYASNTLDIIYKNTANNLHIESLDPIHNLKSRKMNNFAHDYPYRDNVLKLHEIISKYVSNYIDAYYIDDKAITDDKEIEIKNWYEALNTYISNGIYGYVNTSDKITKDDVKKLITFFIDTVCISHANDHLIYYNYWASLQHTPTIVYLDDKEKISIGIAQILIQPIFFASAPLLSVTDNLSYFALDEKGKKCMKEFTSDMIKYQKKLEDQNAEKELSILQPYNIRIAANC